MPSPPAGAGKAEINVPSRTPRISPKRKNEKTKLIAISEQSNPIFTFPNGFFQSLAKTSINPSPAMSITLGVTSNTIPTAKMADPTMTYSTRIQ